MQLAAGFSLVPCTVAASDARRRTVNEFAHAWRVRGMMLAQPLATFSDQPSLLTGAYTSLTSGTQP